MTTLKSTQVDHEGQPLATVLAGLIPAKTDYSSVWAPTAIAAGTSLSANFTVTGAAVGDQVLASFSSALGTLLMQAQITAAATVTVTLYNFGSSTVSLPSGTLKLMVI